MNLQDFTEALELALMNIHDAVERGGVYGILMGNMRRKGEYYNLSSLVERVAPGKLIDEIIKVQHYLCKRHSILQGWFCEDWSRETRDLSEKAIRATDHWCDG